MTLDVRGLRAFYESPLGHLAHRIAARALAESTPPGARLRRVVGLGYASPYLGAIGDARTRRLDVMPAAQGAIANHPGAVLADPTMLPLPDESVDAMLLVHAIENAHSASDLLGEAYRILDPGGRLLLVCPNRRGLWARMDTTPFGHGQPFSRRQLREVLRDAWFVPARWAEILYVPPLPSRFVLSGAAAWERLGVGLSLPLAGLHVVEATKQLHRPIPVRRRARRRVRRPVLVPVPAHSTARRD